MIRKADNRPLSQFSQAVAAEIKGLMASNGITQMDFADALHRNQGYVSERVNGLKAFDMQEIDTLATLCGTDGVALLTTVVQRVEERIKDNVTPFRKNSLDDLDKIAPEAEKRFRETGIAAKRGRKETEHYD